jgi:hypothetical protein
MQVSLYIGSSWEATWENLLLPWFEAVAPCAFEEAGPAAVVTPFRSHAHLLRSKLLARGVSLLGVRFLVPAQLREIMLRRSGFNLPLREHLRLLLGIAAEEIATPIDSEQSGPLVAKSVARDPDYFLRMFDKLGAAGWSLAEVGQPVLSEIAACFGKICRDCGFAFVHEADRFAAANAEKLPPQFNRLLVMGFDGAHWPLWPLLHAAVKSSTQATVILSDPRDEARDVDETWVGTWEEAFGATEPVGEPQESPDKTSRVREQSDNIHFLVGRDTTQQARAIVALTAKFLCESNCERIGILFPQKSALPRLVASFLSSARIAHNDGIAHLTPSAFDTAAWRAWLELQENPRLKFLFQFLRALDADIFGRTSVAEVEEELRDAYSCVLIDDLSILREFSARSDDIAAIARGLEKIRFLPATGTLYEFLAQTKSIFAQFGWKQHWNEVERLSRNWTEGVPQCFSKINYLRWLREILGAPSLSRDDYGAHPYSRVHLLPYSEAEGQSWSHLIFAGLNEEAWPALEEEFVGDREIDQFNRRNRTLNRRAIKRGRHGEGQWSIVEGKTFLLGLSERCEVRRRQLRNLMESPTAGIGLTANLYSESAASRIANPTDFFSRFYFETRGRGVSQRTLQALEAQTRDWLGDWSAVDAQKVDSTNVGRTRYAYNMRRRPRAFGQYEFALHAPPQCPVTLRVTDWEAALKSPAIVWMKIFLGVEPDKENGDAWAAATGQWVHHWLAESVRAENGDVFVELRNTQQFRRGILDSARRFKENVRQLCAAVGRQLPDWWTSGWSNALYVADSLAVKLSDLAGDWTHMASEWTLDSPTHIPLGANESLRVRGRIDLILARGERDESRLSFSDLWVIDYKTGRERGFNVWELRRNELPEQKLRKQLVKGRGVQLALYALAARALGALSVQLTLLGLADQLEPQFDVGHALAHADFWRELNQMQESGVFGMLGPVHAEYGFAHDYPLATLGIDPDLLQEKWVLTHAAFKTEENS